MQILEFSISSVQSQQEPPRMTHPSLNLVWLSSSSTNICTHQQSIPPPPVTLPTALPLTCFHSHFHFMGCYITKKNRVNKANIFTIGIFLFHRVTSVHFKKFVAGFSFFFFLGFARTKSSRSNIKPYRLPPRNKDKSPLKYP